MLEPSYVVRHPAGVAENCLVWGEKKKPTHFMTRSVRNEAPSVRSGRETQEADGTERSQDNQPPKNHQTEAGNTLISAFPATTSKPATNFYFFPPEFLLILFSLQMSTV